MRKKERERKYTNKRENVCEGSSQKENKKQKVERKGRKMTDRWRKLERACQRAGEKTEKGVE